MVKNVVSMAEVSHQSQKSLCQNNPNKILLKVRKYLGTRKNSLEVIIKKAVRGEQNLPPHPYAPPPCYEQG